MSDRKRLLNDLRVTDLRSELEKRNLSKTGVRGILLQRLSKSLEDEGHDPASYSFEVTSAECETPAKRSRRAESTAEGDAEETPAMEDMVVQDDVGEDDEPETNGREEKMQVDETKASRKRESTDNSECSKAKKPCPDADTKAEEQKVTENNTDAEDSINLDIGEDELLNDEADHTAKNKKDEEELGAAQEAAGGDSADGAHVKEEVTSEAAPPSEANDEKKDKDNTDEKEKEKKDDSKESGHRNLWVSGLSGDTRAKDLKQLCTKHGKVVGAKVVTNAKTPGSRCYGYVTMASAQDAENCIKNLHRTELHGRLISVEKAKSESESGSRRHTRDRRSSKDGDVKDDTENKEEAGGEPKPKKDADETGDSNRSTSETRDKAHKDKDPRGNRNRSREHRRSPHRDVLSFSKIWKERDLARARERSRAAREDERRRRQAEDALRERERRQRQEKQRLEIEREKLRAEREKIEREKNELLRLERERHRLEREKLELERLELKRAQLRLEEERRKRSSAYENSGYRKGAPSPPPGSAYERDARHKRPPPPPMMSSRSQFEAPPPPRFDMAAPAYERNTDKRERDYKREYPRHVASSAMKYPPNGSSNDDTRQPLPPGTRAKEPSRTYDSHDARQFRTSPAGKPEARSWNASSRYPDSTIPSKSSNSGAEGWSSSAGGEGRYAGGQAAAYDSRYPVQYPPPAAPYPDRYAQTRDYRNKY